MKGIRLSGIGKSSRKNKHENECGVLDIYIEDIKVERERSSETNSGTCWLHLHHCCLRIRVILLIVSVGL